MAFKLVYLFVLSILIVEQCKTVPVKSSTDDLNLKVSYFKRTFTCLIACIYVFITNQNNEEIFMLYKLLKQMDLNNKALNDKKRPIKVTDDLTKRSAKRSSYRNAAKASFSNFMNRLSLHGQKKKQFIYFSTFIEKNTH